MNRRLLLLGGLGVALSGCSGGAGSGPVVLPSDPRSRVASRLVGGGFVAPGYNELTGPSVAVYANGTAIADAARQLSLSAQETIDLVAAMRRDLSGLPAHPEPHGPNFVADAGTTSLSVRGADGKTVTVSAYALDILDYGKPLKAADERLQKLGKRVADNGKPYVAQRIRLVVVPRSDTSASMRWPEAVPVPVKKESEFTRVSDLSGLAAQAAMANFSRAADGVWPIFDAGGEVLSVAWRYLLPDE